MKPRKINVVFCSDPARRRMLTASLAVRLGFARTRSDARKIIVPVVDENVLATDPYFVLADFLDFRHNPELVARLYQLAVGGIAVVVGTSYLPEKYRFLCEVWYESDLLSE